MTLHTVPPGTLTNCDYLVTGMKVTDYMVLNSLLIPPWIKELIPPYIAPWDRHHHPPIEKESSTYRRIFGCRDRPIFPASAECLPDMLAHAGFSPSNCRVKRVDEDHLAISIYWSRLSTGDNQLERFLLYRTFFREIQIQYSWSVYAKEIRDPDGTRVIAVNFNSPTTLIPSRRTYSIAVEGHQVTYQPRLTRTLYD